MECRSGPFSATCLVRRNLPAEEPLAKGAAPRCLTSRPRFRSHAGDRTSKRVQIGIGNTESALPSSAFINAAQSFNVVPPFEVRQMALVQNSSDRIPTQGNARSVRPKRFRTDKPSKDECRFYIGIWLQRCLSDSAHRAAAGRFPEPSRSFWAVLLEARGTRSTRVDGDSRVIMHSLRTVGGGASAHVTGARQEPSHPFPQFGTGASKCCRQASASTDLRAQRALAARGAARGAARYSAT